MNITYDGNDKETYTLFVDGKETAEIKMGEDAVCGLVQILKNFIEKFDTNTHSFKFEPIAECTGLRVDVWLKNQYLIEAKTFWFKDISESVYGFGIVNIHIDGSGFIKQRVVDDIRYVLSKYQGKRNLFVDGKQVNPYPPRGGGM